MIKMVEKFIMALTMFIDMDNEETWRGWLFFLLSCLPPHKPERTHHGWESAIEVESILVPRAQSQTTTPSFSAIQSVQHS